MIQTTLYNAEIPMTRISSFPLPAVFVIVSEISMDKNERVRSIHLSEHDIADVVAVAMTQV